MGDNIKGGEGQDVIFGDFGVYNAQVEYLPFQNYRPIIVFPDYAGDDTLDGGDNDDFIIGQEVSQRFMVILSCSAVSNMYAYLLREMTALTVAAEAMTYMEVIQYDMVET